MRREKGNNFLKDEKSERYVGIVKDFGMKKFIRLSNGPIY
jgi:hypothetical protein